MKIFAMFGFGALLGVATASLEIWWTDPLFWIIVIPGEALFAGLLCLIPEKEEK